MRLAVTLEYRKMRRLRTGPIVIVLVLAVVALSSAALFSGSTRETFDDPAAHPWAALLLTYTLIAAMTSPIFTAMLASPQTDIEHTGAGWTLAATAGYTPGTLCRAKLVALSVIVLPAILLQTLLVIGAGGLAGIRVPLDAGPWIGYTLLLILVDVAFCALHIWLAATIENQLISLGIGMLGAFLAVFSLRIYPASSAGSFPGATTPSYPTSRRPAAPLPTPHRRMPGSQASWPSQVSSSPSQPADSTAIADSGGLTPSDALPPSGWRRSLSRSPSSPSD